VNTSETYYVDSCIWINLFKKEGKEKEGVPHWKIAKDFIENGNTIIVSTIVIKELSFKIKEKLELAMRFFKDNESIKLIKTVPEDYDLARKFENEEQFKISFYDYLHVAIAKRLNIPLITRDKDLITFAKKHLDVYKPEDLIN